MLNEVIFQDEKLNVGMPYDVKFHDVMNTTEETWGRKLSKNMLL